MSENQPPPHLLIVDDEESIRFLLEARFMTELKCRISTASNGAEAFEKHRRDPADVVLSDVRMPERTGFELLKNIKSITPKTPFILMSGFCDMEEVIKALRLGATDFFNKPFQMRSLVSAIDRSLRIAASQKETVGIRAYMEREEAIFNLPTTLDMIPTVLAEIAARLEGDPGLDPLEIEGVRAAAHEMLINAVEHGNLGISYEEKTKLMENPKKWRAEIKRRSEDPRWSGRTIKFSYFNSQREVCFIVEDQGDGFDPKALPDPATTIDRLHGRGILITQVHMDDVIYNEKGNRVELVKRKRPRERAR